MSFKVFNTETNKWEVQSSTMASSIKVLDVTDKYKTENKNVEGCLSELKDDLADMNKKVDYIYENGTIGGGSGGGGSYGPNLVIVGEREYTVTSDEVLTIQYSFTSNSRGNGIAYLSYAENLQEVEIAQGKTYKWQVGPFPKGEYILTINVCDSQGFWSGIEQIKVVSGALELVDHFEHDQMFLPNDKVEIPYEIISVSNAPVTVEYTLDGVKSTETVSPGSKIWKVQLPNFKGVYKASIKAYSETLSSNVLEYQLIAADSESLLVSSTYPQAPEVNNVKYGQNLVIPFTNSMLGQSYYNTYLYIDNLEEGSHIDVMRSKNGRNYWTVGDRLSIGRHNLKLTTVTDDGQHKASLEFIVEVTSFGFDPHPDTKEGLIAHFEATGNMNTSSNKTTWTNRVAGSDITCELKGFNFSSNGWIEVPKVSDLPLTGSMYGNVIDSNKKETVLRCSGKSHAIINYEPFKNGIPKGRGFTFEIVYRTENTGNVKAKVVSCKNEPLSNRGFDIDTENALITTSNGEQVSMSFNENEWTRISYVVDRISGTMKIFCNGILSGATYIQPLYGQQDGFLYDGPIVLGAALSKVTIPGIDGAPSTTVEEVMDFSNCDIRTIRIYDRALTDEQILDNFIADVKEEDEQVILKKINGLEEGFEMTIPVVNVYPNNNADIENAGENAINTCRIDYQDPRDSTKNQFFENCDISWQGTSSKEYPVKNYTIILKNNGREYYGWAPKDNWYPEARWTLKANYMDSSSANNVGAAKFIHDHFKSNMYPIQKIIRPNSLDGLRETRTNVDGFPIMFKINGQFKGIYTFNIDRYSNNNYGFTEYEEDGSATPNRNIVSYEININNGTSFVEDISTPEKLAKVWDNTIRHEFKHRYNGKTDRPTETIISGGQNKEVLSAYNNHTDLVNLLKWISSFEDTKEDRDVFASELKNHFSIPHLIDYFLICYALGMIDSLGKNMVLTTYGKEEDEEGNQHTIWYPTFYDCDSILGINNVGRPVVTPGAEMHTEYVTQESRLWKWLIEDAQFAKQISSRYAALREPLRGPSGNIIGPATFSVENIMKYFGGHVSDTIGQGIYNKDYEVKYLIDAAKDELYMCQGSRRSFTERWLRERFIFLDSLYGYGDFETKILSMRTNRTGELTLKIKTYSPQKTIVQFSATQPVVLTTDKNKETVFKCNVTNGKDNELKIKGANNLMYIEGLDKLNISELKIGGAERLTNVEIPNSNLLTELELGENKYLRVLDVSNCRKLGQDNESGRPNNNKTLKLNSCSNLRVFKCNNTAIQGIAFPTEGGVLDELDCSQTGLTDFNMTGQEYLDFINLASCPELSKVNISKCDGLTSLSAPGSALSSFIVENCKNLEDVDISYTNQLKTFNIVECPNVKKLNMAGVSNNNIQNLILTSLLKLEELDISGSTSIRHLVFGKNNDGSNFNKLKKLNCKNSAIMSIRYNEFETAPDYLDLAGLPLEEVYFDSCKNVKEIRNIKLITSAGSRAFNECTNLTKITGELTFSGAMTRTFQNCQKLTSIPTGNTTGNRLDLTGVNDMNETFWNCKAINLGTAKAIMSKVSSKLTSSYRVFCGCTGIVTNDSAPLPSDFFSKCTGLTSISEFFNGCTGIAGGLHEDIFKPMTNLQNCYYAFASTKITGGLNSTPLPEGLFASNKKLTRLERMFYNTPMLFVPPENLLATATELTNVYGMFSNCSSMNGTIPELIFKNNSKLQSIGPFFGGCSRITGTIPRRIFDTNKGKNNSITTVEGFFMGTKVTGEIPAYVSDTDKGIFDYSPNLTWTRNCFNGCSGITGPIPENIFKYNTALIRVDGTFQGCSGIGSTPDRRAQIPPKLLSYSNSITNVASLFNGCSNIEGNIPEGFLDKCVNVTDVSNIFRGCRNLVGQIPARESVWTEVPIDPERPELGNTRVETVTKYGLFDKCKVLANVSGAFYGCTGLNSFIPPTLLISGTMITDASYLFTNCYYLQGEVPSDLFKNCSLLQSTAYAFNNCVSLRNPIYDAEDDDYKYAIPKDLFAYNPHLNNVSHMFRMDGGGNPHAPRLIGAVPPELFQVPGNKLRNIRGLFHACTEITGHLDSATFEYNTELTDCYEAFGETKLQTLGTSLFSTCKKVQNMELTFDRCTSLTGPAFDYRSMTSVINKARCFGGCTGLTDYQQMVQDGWAD